MPIMLVIRVAGTLHKRILYKYMYNVYTGAQRSKVSWVAPLECPSPDGVRI